MSVLSGADSKTEAHGWYLPFWQICFHIGINNLVPWKE